MSRRVPSTAAARPASRAPSMARPSSAARLPRAPSSAGLANGRNERAAGAATGSIKVLTEAPETNINVVVRCRGRTKQEINENSPPITTTGGALSKSVTIETAPGAASATSAYTAASTYGAGTPNTKTYPFDKVFGPQADQTMVFHEVAETMLDEVLAGYNCTIFAYGQTGTGKTYTMAGDVNPTPLMEPSTEAGIIPRVLHRLFALLDAQENTEYAVKCSYIEIYNEELRDLLSHDYGMPGASSNIKIFEDAAKKGVFLQGVEEAGVGSLKDGLAILNKGSQRRQVAETKMNTESSRSHSIFTLTVHVKETSNEKAGEDLLRIGKFNLVDLAGSEAIGRSGAENKRAREAGMINQSLLTLGRVISALVEHGTHIPYRESKLTRMLQDSLGGRTKTCIVATISPTKSNMEETLSTLDYALRAKSIKNKPEVNAHLTKAGLLKEYLGDIERLKAELHATREKNGVYIPEEQYKEMTEKNTRQKTDYEEARQRVAAVEVELRTRKIEFETLTTRFVTTTSELAATREAERQLGEALEAAKVNVEAMRIALSEERVVAQAYAAGEERLDSVAGELRSVAVNSVKDVGGLHDKLKRMTTVIDHNTDAATLFGSEMQALSSDLKSGIKQLHTVQGEFGSTLRGDLEAYAKKGERESQKHLVQLDESFSALNQLASSLSSSIEEGALGAADAAAAVLKAKEEVAASVRAWASEQTASSSRMVDELVAYHAEHLSSLGGVLDTTTTLVDSVIAAAREHLTSQANIAARASELASSAAQSELERLRSQNALLARLLQEERTKSATLSKDLVSNITNLVQTFVEDRDTSLSSAVERMQDGNQTGITAIGVFEQSHASAVRELGKGSASFTRHLDSWDAELPDVREQGSSTLKEVQNGVRDQLKGFASNTERIVSTRVHEVESVCGRIESGAAELSNSTKNVAQQVSTALSSLTSTASAGHGLARQYAESGAEEIKELTSTLLASHATSAETSAKAHQRAKRKLDAMTAGTARFLSTLASDEPTGDTPRKRAYPFPQTWERTQPRDVLIDKIRRGEYAHPLASSASTVSGAEFAGEQLERSSQEARDEYADDAEAILESPTKLVPVDSSASLSSLVSDDMPPPLAAPLAREREIRAPRPRIRSKLAPEEERPQLSVLGESGNIPRRRRQL